MNTVYIVYRHDVPVLTTYSDSDVILYLSNESLDSFHVDVTNCNSKYTVNADEFLRTHK